MLRDVGIKREIFMVDMRKFEKIPIYVVMGIHGCEDLVDEVIMVTADMEKAKAAALTYEAHYSSTYWRDTKLGLVMV